MKQPGAAKENVTAIMAVITFKYFPKLLLACGLVIPTLANAAPPAAFGVCSACHRTEPGAVGAGPNLRGVGGRKSGSLPGYDYSAAMKKSRITWDATTLAAFIQSPDKVVPGTKMAYAGQKDPEKAADIVKYLLSLK